MNKRSLPCGKQILAIGMENSKADIENKLETCMKCETTRCKERDSLNSKRLRLIQIAFFILLIPTLLFAEPTEGKATWYSYESCIKEGSSGIMANGRRLNDNANTAASWFYKFGTKVMVTNVSNGKSVIVEITDRGPSKRLVRQGKIIDLSKKAFSEISNLKSGVIKVKVKQL